MIALALANFRAVVTIEPAQHFEIVPGADDRLEYPSLREAAAALDAYGCDDGVRLLRAALRKAVELRGGLRDLRGPRSAAALPDRAIATDIPRQVGLSGSSAIVIAALRALGDWFGFALAPAALAEAALGLRDRRARHHGRPDGPRDPGLRGPAVRWTSRRRARPHRTGGSIASGLPPLFLAWNPRGGAPSRRQHGDVRARWLRGDTEVRAVVAELARLADAGTRCIERGEAGLSLPVRRELRACERASSRFRTSIASWCRWRATPALPPRCAARAAP